MKQEKAAQNSSNLLMISIIVLFFSPLIALVYAVNSAYSGSFTPRNFEKTTYVSVSSSEPVFSRTSPNGMYDLYSRYNRGNQELILESEGKEDVILKEVSKAPGNWQRLMWTIDSRYAVVCFNQIVSGFTDPKYKASCFLFNPLTKEVKYLTDFH